ncbi:hypothetical protein PHYC_00958 [Phycisphaerales bacterium]|nr:hypothetical protein PHYC_00958 [Phycisphaerales bacterium]
MNATATTRGMCQRSDGERRRLGADRPGFSLLDVLVSISVIAVLIGLLLPSFAKVNETARRVVCQSNIRQIGLGVVMYADDYNGFLPPSEFLRPVQPRSGEGKQNMDTLRLSPDREEGAPWDGLGLLYQYGYLSTPKIFYCPSHHGDNPYSAYALAWNEGLAEVICNYHYRGEGPRPAGNPTRIQNRLYFIDPSHSSLIADGLRSQSDYNHKVGVNFFTADLSVHWYDDTDRALLLSLPESKEDAESQAPVDNAWTLFDQSMTEPN